MPQFHTDPTSLPPAPQRKTYKTHEFPLPSKHLAIAGLLQAPVNHIQNPIVKSAYTLTSLLHTLPPRLALTQWIAKDATTRTKHNVNEIDEQIRHGVMTGAFRKTRGMLSIERNERENAMILDELLNTYPLHNDKITSSRQRMHSWRAHLEPFDPPYNSAYHKIALILRGNRTDIAEAATDWTEWLIATLLYVEPDANLEDLPEIMEQMPDTYKKDTQSEIEQALVSSSLVRAIKLLSDIDPWASTHITTLLLSLGQDPLPMPESGLENTDSPAKELLFQYGTWLMTDKDYWEIGVEYLLSIEALEALENLLPGLINVTDTKLCNKVIWKIDQIFGHEQKGNEISGKICCEIGCDKYNKQRYGDALNWFLRSTLKYENLQTSVWVARTVDMILKSSIKANAYNFSTIVKGIHGLDHNEPCLTFLSDYAEFQENLLSSQYSEAASCLPDCVTSCPLPFLLRLLYNSAPLLCDSALYPFTLGGIRIMLSELTNLTLSPFFTEFLEFSQVTNAEVEEIRLALCRCWNQLTLKGKDS